MQRCGRTIGVPGDAIGDAAEGVALLVGGELEAVVNAIELMGGSLRHYVVVGTAAKLLLQNVLVAVGFSVAGEHSVVSLQACHRGVQ